MEQRLDVTVMGAGVVGCAVAQALARHGRDVALLESSSGVGMGLTSRNSGVVHSGIYYAPGSAKARLCVEGQARLYQWCAEHDVPIAPCGKLVVASNPQEQESLEDLHARATANGAREVRLVSAQEALRLEPELQSGKVLAALWCPRTGVVDALALARSLSRAASRDGAIVAFHARAERVERARDGWTVHTARGPVVSRALVNATGLAATQVAHAMGYDLYEHRYSRGDYYRWHGARPFQRLVYPAPRPGAAGLGVHLTLDVGGGVRFGPDAKWVEEPEHHPPHGSLRADFGRLASALVGDVDERRLTWDGCGIRPKLYRRGGAAVEDFVVASSGHGDLHLLGVESPGLTAALALAQEVSERVRRPLA